jgi:hypothetical protein
VSTFSALGLSSENMFLCSVDCFSGPVMLPLCFFIVQGLAPHLFGNVSMVRSFLDDAAPTEMAASWFLPPCGSGQTTVDLLPRCLCCSVRLLYYSRDHIPDMLM